MTIYSVSLRPRYCEFCVSPLLGGEAPSSREKRDRLIQFRAQSHPGVRLSEIWTWKQNINLDF